MTVTIKHEGFSQSWFQWINGWVKKMFLLVLRCSPTENWFHDVPIILGKTCAWENNEQHLYCKVSVRVSLHTHFVCSFSTCIPKSPSLTWKDNLSWLQLINIDKRPRLSISSHAHTSLCPFKTFQIHLRHLMASSSGLGSPPHVPSARSWGIFFPPLGRRGIPKVFRISSATALITGGHTALPSWW